MATVVPTELPDDMPEEAWREVHALLIKAVIASQNAIDAKKAQHRYLLEEICANLHDDGRLVPSSVWKRPKLIPKKVVKKPALVVKRKSKEEAPLPPKKKIKLSAEEQEDHDAAGADYPPPPPYDDRYHSEYSSGRPWGMVGIGRFYCTLRVVVLSPSCSLRRIILTT